MAFLSPQKSIAQSQAGKSWRGYNPCLLGRQLIASALAFFFLVEVSSVAAATHAASPFQGRSLMDAGAGAHAQLVAGGPRDRPRRLGHHSPHLHHHRIDHAGFAHGPDEGGAGSGDHDDHEESHADTGDGDGGPSHLPNDDGRRHGVHFFHHRHHATIDGGASDGPNRHGQNDYPIKGHHPIHEEDDDTSDNNNDAGHTDNPASYRDNVNYNDNPANYHDNTNRRDTTDGGAGASAAATDPDAGAGDRNKAMHGDADNMLTAGAPHPGGASVDEPHHARHPGHLHRALGHMSDDTSHHHEASGGGRDSGRTSRHHVRMSNPDNDEDDNGHMSQHRVAGGESGDSARVADGDREHPSSSHRHHGMHDDNSRHSKHHHGGHAHGPFYHDDDDDVTHDHDNDGADVGGDDENVESHRRNHLRNHDFLRHHRHGHLRSGAASSSPTSASALASSTSSPSSAPSSALPSSSKPATIPPLILTSSSLPSSPPSPPPPPPPPKSSHLPPPPSPPPQPSSSSSPMQRHEPSRKPDFAPGSRHDVMNNDAHDSLASSSQLPEPMLRPPSPLHSSQSPTGGDHPDPATQLPSRPQPFQEPWTGAPEPTQQGVGDLDIPQQDLWTSGTGGYDTFRIPALLYVGGGVVLAFCEGRRASSADSGDIDVLLRRSTDWGVTWDSAPPDDNDDAAGADVASASSPSADAAAAAGGGHDGGDAGTSSSAALDIRAHVGSSSPSPVAAVGGIKDGQSRLPDQATGDRADGVGQRRGGKGDGVGRSSKKGAGSSDWAGRVICSNGHDTCDNATPVYDAVTGHVLLLVNYQLANETEAFVISGKSAYGRKTVVYKSTDRGLTWLPPVDISARIAGTGWTSTVVGPGGGIQLRKGKHAGRIVIPCDNVGPQPPPGLWSKLADAASTLLPPWLLDPSQPFPHGPIPHHSSDSNNNNGYLYGSHVIYSDDHGASWHLGGSVGGTPSFPTNEATVAELADGTLLLNMRVFPPSPPHARAVAWSRNGGSSWHGTRLDESLPDPSCQGSLVSAPRDGGALLFSNAADPYVRVRMTVRASVDGGATWPHALVLHYGNAAYSSLAVVPGGSRHDGRTVVMCLYETGSEEAGPFVPLGEGPYKRIRVARFELRQLFVAPAPQEVLQHGPNNFL
eukprot:jgi/Mesvir1/12752/Mv22820-RA.1